jgi:hypothetical protein
VISTFQYSPRAADSGRVATRLLTPLALACAALALAPGAATDAVAAGKQRQAKPGPTIAFVSPMRVTVGRTIVIRGNGFSARKRRNTVIFLSPAKRTAFAKPVRASKRKLVVRVPGSVERLLVKHADRAVPTRFALRVLAGRYGKATPRKRSPVILSARGTDTEIGGCGKGPDPDGDLLPSTLEKQIKTDPCLADTDGDGSEDGFEYESALDLNQRAVPYPGKRPFPNALDPDDAGNDYDGDGLSNGEEFRAWAHAGANPPATLLQAYTDSLKAPAFAGPYASRPTFGNHSFPLNYSDGLQASLAIGPGNPEFRATLDFDGDGRLTDNERDVDGDGLRNVDEIRALMWQQHYPPGDSCGYEYKPVLPRSFLQVDYLDWDSDGDGVWDGDDDQDNDGVSNVDEVGPPYLECDHASPLPYNGARDGSDVLRNPYNPCLPYDSPTCAIYGRRG